MEIAPGVHSIPVPSVRFMGIRAPNVYIVTGREAALIDSGYSSQESVKACTEYIAGLPSLKLSYILITHNHIDHAGGCRLIREKTGSRIAGCGQVLPAGDGGLAADIPLQESDTLDIGGISLRAVYTPGHTLDCMSYYMPDDEVLFTGDHVLGFGTSVITPGGDMALYMDSLRKLLDLRISLICPGHGPPVREPHRKIRELIAQREEREQQVLKLLVKGKSSIRRLVVEIYPELDPRLAGLAHEQIHAHLRKLIKEGRVSAAGDEYALK